MNPDGTGRVNLTDSANADDNSPSWSPNGSRIAYISDSFARNLMVMNADGTSPTLVTSGALNPSWSPDGTRVAVLERALGPAELVTIDLATGAETVVTDTVAMEPVWSPEPLRLRRTPGGAVPRPAEPASRRPVRGTEIVVVNADGTGEVIVSAGAAGSDRRKLLEEDRAQPCGHPTGRCWSS